MTPPTPPPPPAESREPMPMTVLEYLHPPEGYAIDPHKWVASLASSGFFGCDWLDHFAGEQGVNVVGQAVIDMAAQLATSRAALATCREAIQRTLVVIPHSPICPGPDRCNCLRGRLDAALADAARAGERGKQHE